MKPHEKEKYILTHLRDAGGPGPQAVTTAFVAGNCGDDRDDDRRRPSRKDNTIKNKIENKDDTAVLSPASSVSPPRCDRGGRNSSSPHHSPTWTRGKRCPHCRRRSPGPKPSPWPEIPAADGDTGAMPVVSRHFARSPTSLSATDDVTTPVSEGRGRKEERNERREWTTIQ